MIEICGSKVLLWDGGRPGAGGIRAKTNSALNICWIGVEAKLGNYSKRVKRATWSKGRGFYRYFLGLTKIKENYRLDDDTKIKV